MQNKIWVEICTDIYVQEQKKNTKQMSWLQTRVEILKFESKKICESSSKKKNLSRERENADQLCYQSMSSLHRDEASIQSSGFLATKYCKFFLRILISALWRVQKDTCNSVVKILWDLRLFRNREVHPFYVKSDWNPPVQPLEALQRG